MNIKCLTTILILCFSGPIAHAQTRPQTQNDMNDNPQPKNSQEEFETLYQTCHFLLNPFEEKGQMFFPNQTISCMEDGIIYQKITNKKLQWPDPDSDQSINIFCKDESQDTQSLCHIVLKEKVKISMQSTKSANPQAQSPSKPQDKP